MPIPMTVPTGFLGAGKTTLLNRLLKDTALAETAVIINEFGVAPLDHLLVEYIGDNMVVLQSGCLCCTMRADLVDALLLRDLDNRRCKFRRVLLETTGLADPAPGAAHRHGASLPLATLPARRCCNGGRRGQR